MNEHPSKWTADEWRRCNEALGAWQLTCSAVGATVPDAVDFRAGVRAALDGADQEED